MKHKKQKRLRCWEASIENGTAGSQADLVRSGKYYDVLVRCCSGQSPYMHHFAVAVVGLAKNIREWAKHNGLDWMGKTHLLPQNWRFHHAIIVYKTGESAGQCISEYHSYGLRRSRTWY